MINRGYRYRLYASEAQRVVLAQYSGVCRLIYNLAFEQRRDWWRLYKARIGRGISYASQCRELTLLRREFEWIADVSIICQQQALKDVDQAFGKYFRREADRPTPRKRGEHDSFRFAGRDCRWRKLNRKWAVVALPKIGDVKFRLTRDIPGVIKNVTIGRDALGWHVSFSVEVEHEVVPNHRPAIGIDRGVQHTVALSNGTFMDLPKEHLMLIDRRSRKQSRKAAKCKRGSNRQRAARAAVARTRAKLARIRYDWAHKRTTEIARSYGVVVLEALDVSSMTKSGRGTVESPGKRVRQKAGLNRSILSSAWYQFEVLLLYKLIERGGELRKVRPAYTSQTCNVCGAIHKTSRESQATFCCVDCGHQANADTNAACNILRAGTQPAQRIAVRRPMKRELTEAA